MNKKKLLLAIVLFLVLAVLTIIVFQTRNKVDPQISEITLGSGARFEILNKTYDLSWEEGKSAYELIKTLKDEGKFEFEVIYFSDKPFVSSINGILPKNNEFWEFQVNGKSSDVGISDYIVKKGDILRFQLTIF